MSDLPRVDVDYPASGETIGLGHYTFRISSSEALAEAEISIDRGPWQHCRHAAGMWWYDWRDYGPGEHQVAVRGTTRGGQPVNSTFRRFAAAAR